jgi:hypothetical protein
MTEEEFLSKLVILPEVRLPESLDWRTSGDVTPPKDQQQCGSCWAHTVIGCIESQALIYGWPTYNLSEQYLVSCGDNNGCCGGNPSAFQFLEDNWCVSEAAFPYANGDPEGPRSCQPLADPGEWGTVPCPSPVPEPADIRVTNWWNISPDPQQLKTHLQNGPIYVSFDVHDDFDDYWDGDEALPAYTHVSGGYQGSHAVLLVGYDDPSGYWICKNSYGADGGPEGTGFFYIDYDSNCDFAQHNAGGCRIGREISVTLALTPNPVDAGTSFRASGRASYQDGSPVAWGTGTLTYHGYTLDLDIDGNGEFARWVGASMPSSEVCATVTDGNLSGQACEWLNVIGPDDWLTVFYPNGGEHFSIGGVLNTFWDWGGDIEFIKIELSRDGGTSWYVLEASTPNDGVDPWNVTGPSSASCLVRISDASDGDPVDVSDGVFTISDEVIQVVSPNGGEHFDLGEVMTILWDSSGELEADYVRIDLSRDNGQNWEVINSSTPNDGLVSWEVGGISSAYCRIRVTDADDGWPSDRSESYFTIGDTNRPPNLSNDDVDPQEGFETELFTFSVKYTDYDGDLPEYVRVNIDDVYYPMEEVNRDARSVNIDYEYSRYLTPGTHCHFYKAKDTHGLIGREPEEGGCIPEPVVYPTEPDIDVHTPLAAGAFADMEFVISYYVDIPATVRLYYDSDRDPTSGLHLITDDAPNSPGFDSEYVWPTGGLPQGSRWYVYGVADNGGSTADSYSPGLVEIDHENWVVSPPWSEPYAFGIANSENPRVSVGSDGGLHVVFANSSAGYGAVYYARSLDYGLTWTNPPTQLTYQSDGDCDRPDVAVTDDGSIHVVYLRDVGTPVWLGYSRSTDGGVSWEPSGQISPPSDHVDRYISIACWGQNIGVFYVQEGITRARHADFVHSTDGGTTWLAPVTLHNDVGNTSSQDNLVYADAHGFHVSYTDYSDDFLYYRRSPNWGGSWESAQQMESDDNDSERPDFATSEDRLYLVWDDDVRPRGVYFASNDAGGDAGHWTSPVNVMTCDDLEIACDDQGAVHLVVEEDDTLRYRQYSSTTDLWSRTVKFPAYTTPTTGLGGLQADSGYLYVVYKSAGGVGHFIRAYMLPNNPPTITVLEPSVPQMLAIEDFTITWTGTDPDPGSQLSVNLYYCDAIALDPKYPIEGAQGLPNEPSEFLWDTRWVPGGEYRIFAQITDGEYLEGDLSDGTVLVNHQPSVEVDPQAGELVFADVSHTITWEANDPDAADVLTIDLFYDEDTDPAEAYAIVQGIGNDGSYVWDTSALPDATAWYLMAVARDSVTPEVFAYSGAPVFIEHGTGVVEEGFLTASLTESGSVMLSWTLGSLADVRGFVVYRATSADGPFLRLNAEPIAAVSPCEFEDDAVWPETTFWYEPRSILSDGSEDAVGDVPTSITTGGQLALRLYAPYPSPCRSTTSVQFDLPDYAVGTKLAVYNLQGRLVRTLVDGLVEQGRHSVTWDMTDAHRAPLPSGVYFLRLEADGRVDERKLVVLR